MGNRILYFRVTETVKILGNKDSFRGWGEQANLMGNKRTGVSFSVDFIQCRTVVFCKKTSMILEDFRIGISNLLWPNTTL